SGVELLPIAPRSVTPPPCHRRVQSIEAVRDAPALRAGIVLANQVSDFAILKPTRRSAGSEHGHEARHTPPLERSRRGLAVDRAAPTAAPGGLAPDSVDTGLASYYADAFNGRPTASGEIFDMRDMTAAHRTLPFGTRLRVTNMDNGRRAIVRVNDRGPFVEGRVIDLSLGAARELRMIGS